MRGAIEEAVSGSSRCRSGVGRPRRTPGFGDPELGEQRPSDAALPDDDCGPMLFGRQAQGCYAMP